MDILSFRARIAHILLCLFLFPSLLSAQTTINYNPGDTDANGYDSTGNPLTLSVASGSATQTGVISGTGNVTKTGAGSLTLSATHTYSGDTTIEGGSLTVDSGSSINSAARVFPGYTSDGTLNITAGGQVATSSFVELGHTAGVTGNLDINGAGAVLNSGSYLDVGFDGSGGLTISNGGVVTTTGFTRLGVNNTGVGTANVTGTGSQLNVGAEIALGTFGNGTLTIENGGSVSAQALHFDRLLTGSGTLNLNTGGTLSITTTEGIVNYSDPGDANMNFAGGTLAAGASWSSSVDAVLSNTTTVNSNANTLTLSGVLSGTGGLDKTGSGILNLIGTNTYSGNTTVSEGLAAFSVAANFGTGSITLNGGGLRWYDISDTDISSRLNAFGASGATFDTNGNNVTLAGSLSGSGSLTKIGIGTLSLTAANAYSGGTVLNAGVVEFSALNNLGSGNVTLAGGSLRWAGTTTDISSRLNAIGAPGGKFDTNGNNVSFASPVSSTGTVTKLGSGSLTLSGTNAIAAMAINGGSLGVGSGGILELGGGNSLTNANGGTLTLADGTLRLGGAAFSMFVPTTLTGNASFDSNGNTGGIYGPLSGTGGFTKSGAGVLTVTNANTFSGPVVVNAGTLVVNTATDLGTGNGDVTVNAGAFLAAATHLEFRRTLTLTGSDAVIVSPNHLEVGSAGDGSLSLSGGAILGSGTTTTLAYFAADTGTVNASGTNSVLYANGALRVGFGGNGTLTVAGGAVANAQNLILGSQASGSGTFNLNSGGILQVGGSDGISVGGGSGAFNFAGGTLRVGGDARVVAIPAAASFNLTNLANDIRAIINANTPQGGDTGLTASTPMTLSNASTVDTNGSAATLSGVLSGTGSLTKSGNGTLTLAAANTYSGTTTITAGTLALGVNGALASSIINLGTAGTLDLTAKNAFTIGAAQTLSGTGSVTLGAGKLLTVAGTLAAGNSAGVISLTGNLAFNASSTIAMELAGAGGVAGTDFDRVNVSGSLTLGGTLNVTLTGGYTPAAGNTFQLFNAAGFSGAFATVNLPALPVGLLWNTDNLASGGTLSVVANNAPTISGSPATAVNQDQAYSFTPVATDVENDTLTFSISNKPAWASFSTTTGVLTGTPGNADVGSYPNIVISVSDGIAGNALAAFTITVVNVNDAPTLSALAAPVAATTEDTAVGITFAALAAQANEADIDGTVTDFVVKSVSAGTLAINGSPWASGTNERINNALSATWTPAQDAGGTLDAFVVAARDDSGAESTGTVTVQVTVTAVNDAPVITINTGLTLTEGASATIDNTRLRGTDVDDSATTLQYTITTAPTRGRLERVANAGVAISTFTQDDLDLGRVRYVHDGSDSIADSFAFSLADGGEDGALPVAGTFMITVTAVDDEQPGPPTQPVTEPEPEPAGSPIDGITTNDGTLTNPVITATGTVQGGTLAGTVQNGGTIRDVALDAGARVMGGEIHGNISGNADAPAIIDNARIRAGSNLSNVVIGPGTILEPGVTLGENVRFESEDSIPAGLDLSGALERFNWGDGDQRQVLNLGDDVLLPTGDDDPVSLLRSIQLVSGIQPAGNSAEQATNGEILVVGRNFNAALLPVKVLKAEPGDAEGTFVNADGDIVIVTANRRIVLSYPVLQDKPGMQAILAGLGLSLAYDDRANLILTPSDADAVTSQGRSARALTVTGEGYLSARPDVIALPAARGRTPGMHRDPVPGLPNVTVMVYVFEDAGGELLEQRLAPVPADWPLLQASLAALPGVSEVRINAQGIISLQYRGERQRALSGYQVMQDAGDQARAGRTGFRSAGDDNGDGRADFWMTFPNGDRQLLLLFP